MAKVVSASLKHYCSTPQQPQHDNCPARAASWCSFQRDCAMRTITHKPIKDPMPSCIQSRMTPIFDKVGNKKFLDGCRNLHSSNPSESFHHVIWGMAPNKQFNSSQEIEFAVNLSTCTFNSGFTWTFKILFRQLDIQLSKDSECIFSCIDKILIYQSDYKTTQRSKTKKAKKWSTMNKLIVSSVLRESNTHLAHFTTLK